ncbi:MAG: hypothetical protein IKZ48_07630 [Prevotella sp.]|nr:hypothetical protein [Prevotella sp.]
MKKIYLSPDTEVLSIIVPSIMTGSPGTPDAQVDPGEEEVDPEDIESRRNHNRWDDEDDYEDDDYGTVRF